MSKEKFKNLFKATASILLITLAISISTELIEALYDHRVILGVIAGAFGYDAAKNLIGKLKGLQ